MRKTAAATTITASLISPNGSSSATTIASAAIPERARRSRSADLLSWTDAIEKPGAVESEVAIINPESAHSVEEVHQLTSSTHSGDHLPLLNPGEASLSVKAHIS